MLNLFELIVILYSHQYDSAMIVVTEARSNEGGIPKVVDRWGEPDSSKCILAASIDDRKSGPVCYFCVVWIVEYI